MNQYIEEAIVILDATRGQLDDCDNPQDAAAILTHLITWTRDIRRKITREAKRQEGGL